MEYPETFSPEEDEEEYKQLIFFKEHELKLNNDLFKLTIEIFSNEMINFKIQKINDISFSYFFKEYYCKQIKNILHLNDSEYNDIYEIYNFFCDLISEDKIKLDEIRNKKKLLIKEKSIDLIEKKISNEEMFKFLFNEIKEIKNKNNDFLIRRK